MNIKFYISLFILACLLGITLLWKPLISSSAISSAIFWASDPVKPGESVVLIGNGLKTNSKIQVTRLKNSKCNFGIDTRSSNEWVSTDILQPSDQSIKFIVPSIFQEGVYDVRLTTSTGTSQILLNTPHIYWMQADQGKFVSPGGWIRIFGRNIGNQSNQSILFLKAKNSGQEKQLKSISANTWEARFEIPADIVPDKYQIQFCNAWGFSDSDTDLDQIEISNSDQWPNKVFNVKNYGAKGDGITSDTQSVQSAINAAKDIGGGVVYFPRGRYLINTTLKIPKFVTLKGERREFVNIFWPDVDLPPETWIQGENHFAIEDLTLYAANYKNFILGDLKASETGTPGNVRLKNLTIRANIYRGKLEANKINDRFLESNKIRKGGGILIYLGGENIVITNSDFYGSGRSLVLVNPKYSLVAKNHFYNGRWGVYNLSGSDGVIFEDNQITGADLMSTGGGITNILGSTASQNVYFARNRLSLIHGWDREAMTTDGPKAFYYGSVTANESNNSFILNSLPNDKYNSGDKIKEWEGAGFFILGGTGMGQFAQVKNFDHDIVSLDRSFKVVPDSSSIITITDMQQNYIFLDNEFTDTGSAIQYYGTSINHIASGNRATRAGGFYNSGRFYRGFQPSWFCQFLDNEILEGNSYDSRISQESFLGTIGAQKSPNIAPLALGSIHRRNHLYSNAHIRIIGKSVAAPGSRDSIVENNIVEHSDVGLKIDKGSVGVLQRVNKFVDVNLPFDN